VGLAQPGEEIVELTIIAGRRLCERTPEGGGYTGMRGREFNTNDPSIHAVLTCTRRLLGSFGNHLNLQRR
jgi:hypothetical protein